MRITRSVFILTGLLLVAGDRVVIGQQSPKYGVIVGAAKTAELAKAKTYSWTPSQPSFDKNVDAQIVAAVDHELTTLGLTKVASGKSDVVATYASQRRTDVELKATGAREFPVGVLIVELRASPTSDPLFRVRIDKPLDVERDQLEPAIKAAVAAMFEHYPTRTAPKR
jgi:uncharacterized protein DUF4136